MPNLTPHTTDATVSLPVPLASDQDITSYLSPSGPTSFTGRDIVIPGHQGVNLVVMDLQPGQASMWHRTVSVDYSICVMGRLRCEVEM